jgi:hypothetical protein
MVKTWPFFVGWLTVNIFAVFTIPTNALYWTLQGFIAVLWILLPIAINDRIKRKMTS